MSGMELLKDIAYLAGIIIAGVASFYALKGKVTRNCERIITLEKDANELNTKLAASVDKFEGKIASSMEKVEEKYIPASYCDMCREKSTDKFDQIMAVLSEMRMEFRSRFDQVELDIKELMRSS